METSRNESRKHSYHDLLWSCGRDRSAARSHAQTNVFSADPTKATTTSTRTSTRTSRSWCSPRVASGNHRIIGCLPKNLDQIPRSGYCLLVIVIYLGPSRLHQSRAASWDFQQPDFIRGGQRGALRERSTGVIS